MGMLVLSRRVDEGVTITVPPSPEPQTITIKVIEIRGDKSRIGFDAPRTVIIHRDEIQRVVDIEGAIERPEKLAIRPLIRIGDELPGG